MSATVELPPFNADATCPKCGHDDVDTWYQLTAHCHGKGWCAAREAHYLARKCCEAEHLHRICKRCRFGWAEAVES